MLSKITGICQQTVQARGTPGLNIKMPEQVLGPTARYTMPLGPFTFRDINRLNSQLYTAIKRLCGLSSKASHTMTAKPRKEFGLGADPLHLTYMVFLLKSLNSRLKGITDISGMTEGLLSHYWTHEAAYDWRKADTNNYRTPRTPRSIGFLAQLGVKMHDLQQEPAFGPIPAKGQLLSTLMEISHPPIPLRHLRQRGIRTLAQLANYRHTHILTASELQRKYP